ncbi:unnamed protein product [Brassica napus]|uniref:(rape) hypothetical protein n=1 Tax=Brassica napus TaxID=3708 RepID=A0A816VNI7_BRANA|nr:unnamed protein product [Brassica napus]
MEDQREQTQIQATHRETQKKISKRKKPKSENGNYDSFLGNPNLLLIFLFHISLWFLHPKPPCGRTQHISAVKAPKKIKKLGSEILSLTLKESRILADYVQDKFGVSILFSATAAAAAVFSPPPEDGDDVTATVEEQTKFDMVINDVAIGHRIEVAKAMRALSVPLSQVTELTKDFPKIFMEGVTKDEAEEAKRQLEEADATVSIV